MSTFELFQRLSVALAIGLLIGLERGWRSRGEGEGERAAGVRTHALSGFLGGVWGAVATAGGPGGMIALGLAFVAYSAAIVLFRYRETEHDGSFGMTTVVGAMLAFVLGAYALVGNMAAAAAGGVAVAGLLSLKTVLHDWVKRLTWEELRSALMLLAMTFVALPLLPDRTVDPWGAVNPYHLWILTIMIAAISFAGYVMIRLFGARRGVVFGGIAGGLASSTALTLTNAKLAQEHPDARRSLVAGALIANATMVARILVIAGLINVKLVPPLLLPFAAGGVVLLGSAVYLLWRGETTGSEMVTLEFKNPFEFGIVLQFAALLAGIGIAAKLGASIGAAGVYGVAAISGLADVDAITLSMARLGGGDIALGVASAAVGIAAAVNTISKAVLGGVAGGPVVAKLLGIPSAAAVAAGIAVFGLFYFQDVESSLRAI